MIVRKTFKIESAHVTRNCTSQKSSRTIHGHSSKIEVFLTSDKLDNAGMVYDLSLLGGPIQDFVESMDHTYMLCDKDDPEFKEFIKKSCSRWIETPFNPSAECLSMFVHAYLSDILNRIQKSNGEGNVSVVAVRYHETEDEFAESSISDLQNLWKSGWGACTFSEGVVNEWGKDLRAIFAGDSLVNPSVKLQIDLSDPVPEDELVDETVEVPDIPIESEDNVPEVDDVTVGDDLGMMPVDESDQNQPDGE